MTQTTEETLANILLKAACEYKGTEISTLATVAKEARPYWLHLATAYQQSPDYQQIIADRDHAEKQLAKLAAEYQARQALLVDARDALKMAQSGDSWTTLETTCPKCCPEGDDPEWGAFGNSDEAMCAYTDCRHPLTVISVPKTISDTLSRLSAATGGVNA